MINAIWTFCCTFSSSFMEATSKLCRFFREGEADRNNVFMQTDLMVDVPFMKAGAYNGHAEKLVEILLSGAVRC